MEYPQIDKVGKQFEPYNTMWRFCGEFARSLPQWMEGPFNAINADELASDCDKWWRGSAKLLKTLEGAAQEVLGTMRAQLQEFQQHIPLITALRNPGMRDRHWERLTAACGFYVKADATFSLKRGLQLGLPAFLGQVRRRGWTAAVCHFCSLNAASAPAKLLYSKFTVTHYVGFRCASYAVHFALRIAWSCLELKPFRRIRNPVCLLS